MEPTALPSEAPRRSYLQVGDDLELSVVSLESRSSALPLISSTRTGTKHKPRSGVLSGGARARTALERFQRPADGALAIRPR